jgi:hypothetical protein
MRKKSQAGTPREDEQTSGCAVSDWLPKPQLWLAKASRPK